MGSRCSGAVAPYDQASTRYDESTFSNYGHLCQSSASHLLTHAQLVAFASIARVVHFAPHEVIYAGGDQVRQDALFYLVKGSAIMTKYVELKEHTQIDSAEAKHGGPEGASLVAASSVDHLTAGPGVTVVRAPALNSGSGHITSVVPARWTNVVDENCDAAFKVKLRAIESGQWSGYCTMLNMTIRQCTFTAVDHTTCLVWEDHALHIFFAQYPGTSLMLHDGLAGQRLMRKLCTASFFTNMQEEHAALMCTLFQSRHIPSNTVIFEEGEQSKENSSLFFLVTGNAVMYQLLPGAGQVIVKTIEPGDFFGEACMIFRLPRIGTVRTSRASLVMELSFASFAHILRYTPGLAVNINHAFNNNTIAMNYLLQNTVILRAFMDFSAAEHSEENVEFWVAAKAFRQSSLKQKALIALDARAIYNAFISISAPKEVNLSSFTLNRVSQALEHNIINKLTFEEAEAEILHLMERDSFGRFRASVLFQEALQRCRDNS